MRRPMWVATTPAAPSIEAVPDFLPCAPIHDRQHDGQRTLALGYVIYLQCETRLWMMVARRAPQSSQAQNLYDTAEAHSFDAARLSTTLLRDAVSRRCPFATPGAGDACA